jgi:probable selenium-dependent hydroxylase accessory protein YqeC
METVAQSLYEGFFLCSREMVAIVGGGGKSTLMLSLSREVSRLGKRVLATTTTKVWNKQARAAGPLVLTDRKDWQENLIKKLGKPGVVFLGGRLLENGKVEGVPPDFLDSVFSLDDVVDAVVVEADGAAGKPLKSPEPFEPVIPARATAVVAMIGLEALGKPMSEELVFRPARFHEVTGLKAGDSLKPSGLARLFTSPAGLFQGSPEGVRRIAFLNKLDVVNDVEKARELGVRIIKSGRPWDLEVILGSLKQGRFYRLAKG